VAPSESSLANRWLVARLPADSVQILVHLRCESDRLVQCSLFLGAYWPSPSQWGRLCGPELHSSSTIRKWSLRCGKLNKCSLISSQVWNGRLLPYYLALLPLRRSWAHNIMHTMLPAKMHHPCTSKFDHEPTTSSRQRPTAILALWQRLHLLKLRFPCLQNVVRQPVMEQHDPGVGSHGPVDGYAVVRQPL